MINAQIFPLNEGYYTIGFDKIFHAFNPKVDVLEDRSRGSLLVEIQPFLIQSANKNILLDTGLGFTDAATGQLMIAQNLAAHDLQCDDITDIVMSHLHKDHAGGLFYLKDREYELTFPNATYHINMNEYEFATEDHHSISYNRELIQLLGTKTEINWFKNGHILDFIDYEEDGGHCPHHTSFLIHLTDGEFFFGGDVAPQLKQLLFRYEAKYDFDGRRSMELRTQYAKKGKENDWTFLFYHDVSTPMAKL